MRTPKTFFARYTSFRRNRLVCALLIALTLLVPVRNPFTVSAVSAPTVSTIVLETAGAPLLPGTVQLVHAGPNNEWNPHVECDVVTYSYDDLVMGRYTIHYQDLSTGIDSEIPGNGVDLQSDISGPRVVFTEVTFSGDTVRIFDLISQTTTVVPGFGNSNPSISGDLIAFEDRSSGTREIATYDVTSGTITKLTNDSFDDISPKVSPNGSAVVWEKCQPNLAGCDVYAAIQISPGVFTTRALTNGSPGSSLEMSTNDEVAVYISNRTGERDIYYQPLTGGTEVHLSIAGDQWNPRISGDLISFEQWGENRDIFVYDIRSGILYQATNTLEGEYWGDMNVCGDTGRIIYHKVGGEFDLYSFTFQVPSVPSEIEDQLDDLIALVRSFSLPPGISNSLITKLQRAIDAVNASDTATACTLLTAFVNECRAQSGKKLTPEQSAQLINSANQIKTSLGCP